MCKGSAKRGFKRNFPNGTRRGSIMQTPRNRWTDGLEEVLRKIGENRYRGQ